MSNAKNNPVNQPGKEFHTSDVPVGQRGSRNLDTFDNDEEPLVALADGLADSDAAYMGALAFMEEPVKINISKSHEKRAPNVVQCFVNGKGAEQLVNGKWAQCGWLPVGKPVITKRKYVEVLARARQETISTRVVEHKEFEENLADRDAGVKYPFSVMEDRNPRGTDWLSTILQER